MGGERNVYVSRVTRARAYSHPPFEKGLRSYQAREEFMAKTKENETVVKIKRLIPKENLEVAAYYHWLNRGCPKGGELSDWVEAKKELAGTAK